MSNITVTVPLDYFALTRASDMLHDLALDLEKRGEGPKSVPSEEPRATTSAPEMAAPYKPEPTQAEEAEQEEKDAATVFGSQPGKPAPGATEAAEAPSNPNGAAQPAPAAASPGTASADTPAAPAGVDLAPATTASDQLIPWDHRIHAGSKAKLAKKPHGWKMKRGVTDEVVAEVEAELIAVMSASPANPVEPASPAPAPAPAPTETETTAPAAGAITTFPALMQRITASGVAQADVTAAVNNQGLQALPLLAARPDLVPAVAAELFPGG